VHPLDLGVAETRQKRLADRAAVGGDVIPGVRADRQSLRRSHPVEILNVHPFQHPEVDRLVQLRLYGGDAGTKGDPDVLGRAPFGRAQGRPRTVLAPLILNHEPAIAKRRQQTVRGGDGDPEPL